MKMSCNGCRVLRKGCSNNCSIRPCLQWIKNPEAQGNATLFLAKFYGRAGLLNLINAGADHLRPAIFRSLLYEACGRIVNPTYGSVGLLWSGRWQLCQAAVEAVLKGAPIMQIYAESTTGAGASAGAGAADSPLPPLQKTSSYDIRHIGKAAASAGHDLHKVIKPNSTPFKRSGLDKPMPPLGFPIAVLDVAHVHDSFRWSTSNPVGFQREPSHDSSATQASDPVGAPGAAKNSNGDSRENESAFSVETVEASMVTNHGLETGKTCGDQISEETEVGLELTLGFESMHGSHSPHGSSGSSHGHHPSPRRREPRPEQCFLMAVGGSASLAGRIQGST